MAIVKETVVKEGWENIHAEATEKLANFDLELEQKVAEYRAKLIEEIDNEKVRWEKVLELSTDVVEKEVPDEEVIEGTKEEVAEEV